MFRYLTKLHAKYILFFQCHVGATGGGGGGGKTSFVLGTLFFTNSMSLGEEKTTSCGVKEV